MIFNKFLSKFKRRDTLEVTIGDVKVGSSSPIVLQSMATAPTTSTEAAVVDALEIVEAKGEIVRYTASSVAEANGLEAIKKELLLKGCNVPLVADVHFNPKAAFVSALFVEKVRINPGNFATLPRSSSATFSPEEAEAERKSVEEKFKEFLSLCKEHNRAIRIGVNHGSLSARIMAQYGDSIEGMTQSAMEFLRVCKSEKFDNVVISMKSSSVAIMCRAYRSIVVAMQNEEMKYPLHLGVTEAGEGEDGRIRSVVGIGTILNDGIGDTIRVSLTEPPAAEIECGEAIKKYLSLREEKTIYSGDCTSFEYDPQGFNQRESIESQGFRGKITPRVIFSNLNDKNDTQTYGADFLDLNGDYITLNLDELESNLDLLRKDGSKVVVFESDSPYFALEARVFALILKREKLYNPLILKRFYTEDNLTDFIVKSGIDFGLPFVDGLADAIWIGNRGSKIENSKVVETAFSILQSSRARITKTEFISCPGCGRTQFSLQQSVKKVKECCSKFSGLKIAVMGCIVNGPGEMADADYGYVGAGKAVVNLYRGKTVVEKAIPEDIAPQKLVELIENDLNNTK